MTRICGLLFCIPFVTQIDPEQFGLIHAPRRKEADRQRIQRELNTEVRENGLNAVRDAVVELVPRLQQAGPFQSRIIAGRVHLRLAVFLRLVIWRVARS